MNRKELLEQTFETIFQRLSSKNLQERTTSRVEAQRDFSQRGMLQSGPYVLVVSRIYTEAIHRLFFGFIEEVAQLYKENKKYEPNFFWETCREFLLARLKADISSSKATIKSHIASTMGTTTSIGQNLDRNFDQVGGQLIHSVENYIRENLLKSSFISTKSHEERVSLRIPDVAVMMWFPKSGSPEAVDADLRYKLFKKVTGQLSNDRAALRKFDDPEVVPGEQITPSVEIWLQKSAIVICDFTGNRGNVFYEFGYARAVGTDLICICPIASVDELPSHVKGFQMLVYDTLEDLEKQLSAKLSVVLQRHDLLGS